MAAARAGVLSRLPPRSTRPARSQKPSATAPSCSKPWPATISKDSTSVDAPVPDYEASLGKGVKGLKVGVPKEYRIDGMPAEIEKLWQQGIDWLKAAGATIHDVSLPHTKHALPAYYIVAPAEASSNLARYDGMRFGLRVPGNDLTDTYEKSRAEGFGKEVKRRIIIGTYVLSAGYYDAYYLQAQKVRTLIKRDFDEAYKKVDVLLTPATPGAAFALKSMNADPIQMYLQDVFTVTVNMAGLPGIAVPAGLAADGLPLGLQLIGQAVRRGNPVQGGRGHRDSRRPLHGTRALVRRRQGSCGHARSDSAEGCQQRQSQARVLTGFSVTSISVPIRQVTATWLTRQTAQMRVGARDAGRPRLG